MQRFIQEWFSPDFHDPMYLPLLLMLLALIAGLARLAASPRLRDLLLLLVTIPAALRSMRHIPILVLVLVPMLAEMAEAWLQQRGAQRLLQVGHQRLHQANCHGLIFLCWSPLRLSPWSGCDR